MGEKGEQSVYGLAKRIVNMIAVLSLCLTLTACSKQTTVHLSTTEPDEPVSQVETVVETEAGTPTYVLNTASKKIHLPGCGSVAKIKDENKEDYSGPISDLEGQGYTRCGSCKPE